MFFISFVIGQSCHNVCTIRIEKYKECTNESDRLVLAQYKAKNRICFEPYKIIIFACGINSDKYFWSLKSVEWNCLNGELIIFL